jgi:hypothetical protein
LARRMRAISGSTISILKALVTRRSYQSEHPRWAATYSMTGFSHGFAAISW